MSDKEQLNEMAPLIAALMGALVGMGLERNKAQKAAAQAVNDAQTGAWKDPDKQTAAAPQGADYNKTMRRGSRGEGVKQLQQKLGMRQADGIFGPATETAVRTFQRTQGIKVDGIVGPETRARIMKLASNNDTGAGDQAMARRNAALDSVTGTRIDPGTTAGGPSQLKQRMTTNSSKENTGNQINEDISITGEVEDLIRMMQLAGADGAKAVDADDINPGPKPCPICGKMHGPSQPMGGCGSKPKEPGMGDMIKLMAPEEDMAEEEGPMGDEYDDEPSAPDEEYMNDVSASMPAGDDLHKKKKAYPAVDGGDNPMTAENLEAKIKEYLSK
jgi:peptidoglycan hydrolase-like protein with peptidoglycan-binding domain